MASPADGRSVAHLGQRLNLPPKRPLKWNSAPHRPGAAQRTDAAAAGLGRVPPSDATPATCGAPPIAKGGNPLEITTDPSDLSGGMAHADDPNGEECWSAADLMHSLGGRPDLHDGAVAPTPADVAHALRLLRWLARQRVVLVRDVGPDPAVDPSGEPEATASPETMDFVGPLLLRIWMTLASVLPSYPQPSPPASGCSGEPPEPAHPGDARPATVADEAAAARPQRGRPSLPVGRGVAGPAAHRRGSSSAPRRGTAAARVVAGAVARAQLGTKRVVFAAWRALSRRAGGAERAVPLLGRLRQAAVLQRALLAFHIHALQSSLEKLQRQLADAHQAIRIAESHKTRLEEWNGAIFYECRQAKTAREYAEEALQQVERRFAWASDPLTLNLRRPLSDQHGAVVDRGVIHFARADPGLARTAHGEVAAADPYYMMEVTRYDDEELQGEEELLRRWANTVLYRDAQPEVPLRSSDRRNFLRRYAMNDREMKLRALLRRLGRRHWIFARLVAWARGAKAEVLAVRKRGAGLQNHVWVAESLYHEADVLSNVGDDLAACDHWVAMFCCLFYDQCADLLTPVMPQEVWERTTREERAELVVQLAARLGLHHGLTVAGLAAGDRAQTVPLLGKMFCYSVLRTAGQPTTESGVTSLSRLILPDEVEASMARLMEWMADQVVALRIQLGPWRDEEPMSYTLKTTAEMFDLRNIALLCAALGKDRLPSPPGLPPAASSPPALAQFCVHVAELLGAQLGVAPEDLLQPPPHLGVAFLAALYNRVHQIPPKAQCQLLSTGPGPGAGAAGPARDVPLPELSPAVVADLMVAAEDSALVEEEMLRVRNILGPYWPTLFDLYRFHACIGLNSCWLGFSQLEAMLEEANVMHQRSPGRLTRDILRRLYYQALDVPPPPSLEEVKAHRDRHNAPLNQSFSVSFVSPSFSRSPMLEDGRADSIRRSELFERGLSPEQDAFVDHLDLPPAAFLELLLRVAVVRYGLGLPAAGKAGFVSKPLEQLLARHFQGPPQCGGYNFEALRQQLLLPALAVARETIGGPLQRIFRRYSLGKTAVGKRRMPFVAFYVLLAECKILTDPLPPELPPECPELQPGTFGKCMALLERRSTPSPARNHAGFVDRFLGLNLWCCAHQLQHFQNPPPEGMGQPLTAAKVRAMQHQMSNADCGYAKQGCEAGARAAAEFHPVRVFFVSVGTPSIARVISKQQLLTHSFAHTHSLTRPCSHSLKAFALQELQGHENDSRFHSHSRQACA